MFEVREWYTGLQISIRINRELLKRGAFREYHIQYLVALNGESIALTLRRTRRLVSFLSMLQLRVEGAVGCLVELAPEVTADYFFLHFYMYIEIIHNF